MPEQVLLHYNIGAVSVVRPFGTGLINHTWYIETSIGEKFILQRVNLAVFKNPELIAANISQMAGFLSAHHPGYLFPRPVQDTAGNEFFKTEDGGFYRLIPFVEGSHTVDVVSSPGQAFAAASAFGKFTRLLSPLDISTIGVTIPGFHDLSSRYNEFINSLQHADPARLELADTAVKYLLGQSGLVRKYEGIMSDPAYKIRITHHDTKISNVLFDDAGRTLCVIDLDTVMPGLFISDLGDMIRTYVCPVTEEEQDLSLITIREDYLDAILKGYLSEMDAELNPAEKTDLLFAGQFIIYMQAIRFITDFLNNDKYYGAAYPLHNLNRGLNQAELLKKLDLIYNRA